MDQSTQSGLIRRSRKSGKNNQKKRCDPKTGHSYTDTTEVVDLQVEETKFGTHFIPSFIE
jgi:hypothetical protein